MYGNDKTRVGGGTLVVLSLQGLQKVMFYVQSDCISKYKKIRLFS